MKDLHLVVGALSGEVYVSKIKKDGTMSDDRQKIPRSEVLAFIHNWAVSESELMESDVIKISRDGIEVLSIKVENKDIDFD